MAEILLKMTLKHQKSNSQNEQSQWMLNMNVYHSSVKSGYLSQSKLNICGSLQQYLLSGKNILKRSFSVSKELFKTEPSRKVNLQIEVFYVLL